MTTSVKIAKPPRGPGRPREFDIEAALDGALLVFRERGYHAASLGDLGAAMRLTAGSIYKAFSDKRAIFLAAFARYLDVRDAALRPLLNAETNGLAKIRALFAFYVASSYGAEGRRGCLVVGSATNLATFDPDVAAKVTAALQRIETRLRDLVRLGQSDGSIPAGIDADATALALLCCLQGFRVVGKTRRTRAELQAAADAALRLVS
jgi:TetR/AcrR family transcriptional regulator, transcriptional repressor for nem operon